MLVSPCGWLSPTQTLSFQESRVFSLVMDTWEGALQTSPPASFPSFICWVCCGMSLWSVGLSLPSYAPPQVPVHPQPPGWWGGWRGRTGSCVQDSSEIGNTSLYYQHCFQQKSKKHSPVPAPIKKITLFQPKSVQVSNGHS